MQIAGFVLAGGRSRRMGRDKAMLLHESGRTMLERTAAVVGEACGGAEAVILGPAARYAHTGLRILEDVVEDRGPLGGVYTAMREGGAERVLVVPVDLPNLTAAFLQKLIALAGERGCAIAQGQPLCGVYHCETALPVFGEALAAGRLRMTEAAKAVGAVEAAPEDATVLANWNTPGDWGQAF